MSLTVVKGLQSEIFVPNKRAERYVYRSCNSSRCSQEEPGEI